MRFFFLFTGESIPKMVKQNSVILPTLELPGVSQRGWSQETPLKPIQFSALDRVSWSRTLRALFSRDFSMSRDGHHCASTQSPTQKIFLMFRQNLLCLSLCPLPFALSLSTSWEDPGFIILAPSLRVFNTLIRLPLSLFCSRLTSSSPLSLSSWERCSSPFNIFVSLCWTLQYVHISFVLRNPELDTVFPVWLHQCWGKGGHWGPQPFAWPLSWGPLPTHRKPLFSPTFLFLPG